MNCFVTGAAGFIGSNLVDRLLKDGHTVTGFDNFSTGRHEFLADAQKFKRFNLYEGDTQDPTSLTSAMKKSEIVFHLAANADVRFGTNHPRRDLEQNTLATFNVLEAMRSNQIKRIVFSSTGSVYGEAQLFPTPEEAPFPIQTSLYGASKLAGESLIQAYCEGYGFQGFIFRFVSILGERYTHGHVFDFYKNLKKDASLLNVLGDGHQRKSYLHIQDCLDAILISLEKLDNKVNILNLGTDEYCEVNESINWICGHLGVQPELIYSGGERGWIGDNPFIFLDCSRVRQLGWQPRYTIREGIIKTVDFLRENEWVLEIER